MSKLLIPINDYSARVQYIEFRFNLNTNEDNIEELMERLKNQKTIFTVIGGTEIGEKEGFEHVVHKHSVLLYKSAKSIQGFLNEIGILKMKNYVDEQLGFDIKQIPKENITERIKYCVKKETKISEQRTSHIKFNEDWWDLFGGISKLNKKKKSGKTCVELQHERLKIAREMIYDDILISEDPDVIEHKGYFAGTAGVKFYGSVRDAEVEKKACDKYECLPDNVDIYNKGEVRAEHNILVWGQSGLGKTRTMLKLLNKLKKKFYMITPRPYMDRYDPRKYDVLFWDDIDATDIKEFGGVAKFKKLTDGKKFTYEEKYMKACISDYKAWWMTSNTMNVGEFKDKNDKNDNCGLAEQIGRRFHILTIDEFCKNFGIRWDKIKKDYYMVEPVPLYHHNNQYIEKREYEQKMMNMEDKKEYEEKYGNGLNISKIMERRGFVEVDSKE